MVWFAEQVMYGKAVEIGVNNWTNIFYLEETIAKIQHCLQSSEGPEEDDYTRKSGWSD